MRYNLDPLSEYDDDQLWNALAQVWRLIPYYNFKKISNNALIWMHVIFNKLVPTGHESNIEIGWSMIGTAFKQRLQLPTETEIIKKVQHLIALNLSCFNEPWCCSTSSDHWPTFLPNQIYSTKFNDHHSIWQVTSRSHERNSVVQDGEAQSNWAAKIKCNLL